MPSLLEQTIALANDADELQRQQDQHDRFSVYVDDYDDKINAKIKKQFHAENYERLYLMICAYWNLLKKIVNLKSVLYKKEAVRQWMKANGKEIDENYQKLIEDSNIHASYQTLNKYVNINNTGFMRILTKHGGLKYEAVPSENINVLRKKDDPLEILALLHKIVVNEKQNEYFYYYWDPEITCKLPKELKNPYDKQDNLYRDPNTKIGIIPYVAFWSMQPLANSFWNETLNNDLYNGTIQLNVHLTHLNNLLKCTSYKQWVFTGLLADDIKAIYTKVTDGLNPIAIKGQNANASANTMVENLLETLETIDKLAARIMDQHGVEFESQSDSGQKASGYAIQLRQDALNDLKQEQQPLFRQSEKEVAYKSVIISNTDLKAGIDVLGKHFLTFSEEDPSFTADDREYYDWLVDKGYKTRVEIFRMFNPDVPEKDVEKKLLENLAKNREMKSEEPNNEINEAFQNQQMLLKQGAMKNAPAA